MYAPNFQSALRAAQQTTHRPVWDKTSLQMLSCSTCQAAQCLPAIVCTPTTQSDIAQ